MNNNPRILAIETSCDETAASVVEGGKNVISTIVASQMDIHRRFGGVVPEVASRHHVENMTAVVEEALVSAGMDYTDLDAIAVTSGPGLVGALLVGVNTAKALAYAHDLPLLPIHHIAGHIHAAELVADMEYPAMALVVSGGHTSLIYLPEEGAYETIGETRDDAVGEAYDKVARTLKLPYPGGPEIDRLASEGEVSIDFPRAWLENGSYDFSFSGLKSSVLNAVHNAGQRGDTVVPENVAASFQASVVDVLVERAQRAVSEYEVEQLIVTGGVAANRALREAMKRSFPSGGNVELIIPPLSLCTDNAAMIGAAANISWKKGERAGYDLNGEPGLALG
ncbi:tRNA (adenosine(37)-N6)-threonylcarbamoyltransferase complex transferase subunit TsaD [Salicibibacter halophilus]|uniref:tRNA N6-adenosine threonylcarbamoyltransferase n=2 Tax=Salicibibacter halophilus TaxID=2502791 RepID=A0A514LKZ6_9BACI|nr:tRNA (adenosine(37)-N6)-threonylcarbamoyltransferase complex transferase subunit TsaD [Salicibibacter halophilus]QDI92538.1 tRNA (adenosine(37)-N6)-threonylcarbamoyltransferase complex transferase subunit TsaD [Salicibibacter halophilus]